MKLDTIPFEFTDAIDPEVLALVQTNKEDFGDYLAYLRQIRMLETSMRTLTTTHHEFWDRMFKKDTMLDVLAGRCVVDLGCGNDSTFREMLTEKGVETYIGVDQVVSYEQGRAVEAEFGLVLPLNVTKHSVSGALIRGDMLDVVARIPDSSCSFTINGVDESILDPNTDYAKEVVAQVIRATERGGFIVGVTTGGGILRSIADEGAMTDQTVAYGSLKYMSLTKV